MPHVPPWSELLFLMVFGPDRSMQGRIRHDDGSQTPMVGWARAAGDPPPTFVRGSGDVVDVWCWGARLRVGDPDGRVKLISDGETAWSFAGGADDPPAESPADHVGFGQSGTELLLRTDARRWLGDDFTRPAGPAVATTFLGRAAWGVELAPPRHKPHPLQLVVDAETGMLLQQRNDAFGVVSEWTALSVGEDLDPALFTWSGAVRSWEEQRAEVRRASQEDEDLRAGWPLEHLGTERLTVTVESQIEVHYVGQDGHLDATLSGVGSLMRRPTSRAPWPQADSVQTEGMTHRWSDSRWDWALQAWESRLAPGSLAWIQRQLGAG